MVKVRLATPMLKKNDEAARENRDLFREKGVFVLNLMSSPGSGKTSILERTLEHVAGKLRIGIIEGDIYTARDAERIEVYGVPVVQINTGGACHLDARMISQTLEDFQLADLDLLIIENVGNLVCPAEFDLGEDARAVVLSITEGSDKPLKYPLIFRLASAVLINKIDLLDYTDCDLSFLKKDLNSVNSELQLFEVSARRNEGFGPWLEWLCDQAAKKKQR